MKATVQYDGNVSDLFTINNGVKQGCVHSPTIFGILLPMLLKLFFFSSTVRVKPHTRSDGRLFNSARLKAKSKVRKIRVRDQLFADDAALVVHFSQDLQTLLNQLSSACTEFGLAILKN